MGIQVTVSANQIDKERLGYQAISIDSFTSITAITIKAGSKVEVGGALYEFTGDETESGGTWAGIGASTVVYCYLVPAGASISWVYSSTAPTWDMAKQGWYNGSNRAFAIIWKDAGSAYAQKKLMVTLGSQRQIITTSGALGTLLSYIDTDYALSASTTATLPSAPMPGCRMTFKSKGAFTTTITASGGATIGTTSSTSFVLYAMEDYVTLEWDGTSVWYVVATNGPVQLSDQTAFTTATPASTWTAIGNGLTLGTVPPGVYDFVLETCVFHIAAKYCIIAIGNGTTPITSLQISSVAGATCYTSQVQNVKGYVMTASATIQGIFFSADTSNKIEYTAGYNFGRIYSRRIG